MSAKSPIPLEDAPEVQETFISFVAGAGIDEAGIVLVTLAVDRQMIEREPNTVRRVCARLVMAEPTARTLAKTLMRAVDTAESFRKQKSSPQ